jgi:hypothetical protein
MIIETNKGKAILHKGKPKEKAPKTWKRIETLSHNIGNAYNPSHLELYQTRKGILKYGIFRDCCFFEFYGTFEFIK